MSTKDKNTTFFENIDSLKQYVFLDLKDKSFLNILQNGK